MDIFGINFLMPLFFADYVLSQIYHTVRIC